MQSEMYLVARSYLTVRHRQQPNLWEIKTAAIIPVTLGKNLKF